MTPEELTKLFTKFFRAKNRTTQEVSGTGLGLAITQSLVEMHGGQITVTSESGVGTTFTVMLPRSHGTTTSLATPKEVFTRGGRILVVEDEPDIANLIRRYLERAGYHVTIAQTAGDGLKIARADRPDLITLDLNLPDTDGFTLLEWLKGDDETRGIPVMLLSIMADDGHGRQLGAVDYVVKPVEERVLLTRVGRRLAQDRPGNVLVADDDEHNRRLISGQLERAGYRVFQARDGDEAIAIALAEDLELILLDVRMPNRDGIATVETLRSDPRTRDCPIIMITGSPSVLEALPNHATHSRSARCDQSASQTVLRRNLAKSIARERHRSPNGNGNGKGLSA